MGLGRRCKVVVTWGAFNWAKCVCEHLICYLEISSMVERSHTRGHRLGKLAPSPGHALGLYRVRCLALLLLIDFHRSLRTHTWCIIREKQGLLRVTFRKQIAERTED